MGATASTRWPDLAMVFGFRGGVEVGDGDRDGLVALAGELVVGPLMGAAPGLGVAVYLLRGGPDVFGEFGRRGGRQGVQVLREVFQVGAGHGANRTHVRADTPVSCRAPVDPLRIWVG